ncbi:MAG: glycine cleavage system aminomethyltransferase GcvT [Syntrophomonadaceae bacterium]|nr:glycine cleavage system aminomethyltransferase GcvT [Syntrophomonadaceae bacterium]
MSLKKTPLYDVHLKYKGKIVDYGGWELPVQYEGIKKEHNMVREKAGLFDVSHMGEIEVTGENASQFLQYLLTNDISKMSDNQIIYSFMCYPHGGVVDDLLVYKYSNTHYLLVVNAANVDKDREWLEDNLIEGVEIKNLSDDYALIAIQGPLAEDILQKTTTADLQAIKPFTFNQAVNIAGKNCLVSRTGYTGEDGFEIYLAPDDAILVWEDIMQKGGEDIKPAGLGARDSLRLEAKLPLYGQEITADITPLEAKLGFAVKLDKDDFIGKAVLLKQKENNIARTLVEFEMIGKGIPRSQYEVAKDGEIIGLVTSGLLAPTLQKNLGLALIKKEFDKVGEPIEIIIRGKSVNARIVENSFYNRKKN